MHRFIIALSLTAIATSALPAFAGPNGTTYPPFFPIYQQKRDVTPSQTPHALLGDDDQSRPGRALPPGVTGKHPTRAWQRRPSEGR